MDTLLEQVRQEYLRRITRGDGTLLREVEHYAAARTGKMLRPRMLLTAAATLGDEHLNSRRTLLLAVAVEMLHNASLLHDDVVDNDLQRRGQPSVNARYGNATAVLVGDYLLAQIMNLLDEVDDHDATRRINRTVMAMTEAELLQQEVTELLSNKVTEYSQTLSHPDTQSPSNPDTYLRIIDGKTARLFATAAALGNPDYEEYGLHYGRLFQMRDDLADGEAPVFVNELIEQEMQEINNLKYKLSI